MVLGARKSEAAQASSHRTKGRLRLAEGGRITQDVQRLTTDLAIHGDCSIRGHGAANQRAGNETELLVFRRWQEFHREALGFMHSWDSYEC
jgi:hypothetical protein